MGAQIAHIAKTPETMRLEHLASLVEILRDISKLLADPKKLQEAGKQVATAYALTEPELKARDEAIAYLKHAEDVKRAIDDEHETLRQKRQEIISLKNQSIVDINDHKKKAEFDLKNREDALNTLRDDVARFTNALAAREEALKAAEKEDAERKRELLVLEARNSVLVEQIESMKNALKTG